MVKVDKGRLVNLLLLIPFLGVLTVVCAFLLLPTPGIAQISTQTASTVACNSLVSATSHITLVGTIFRDPLTPTPVSNVQVFVFDTNIGDGRSCLSNSNGQYLVTMDAAHTYDVVYNPPSGSHLASQIRTGISGPGVIPRDIFLNPGFSISGVTRRLTNTSPVSNVGIFAHNQYTGIDLGLPTSQDNGTYQISLESGTWDLTFTPPPFRGLGPTTTGGISLTADLTLDAFLPTGTTVYGQIISPGGQGVPGTAIFAQVTGTPHGFGFDLSKEDGLYTGTLPVGEFDIQFIPPSGLGLGSTIITNQTPTTSTYFLPVTLPAGVTLSGSVACTSALEGVFVFADPQFDIPGDDLGGWGNSTDSQGRFDLALVPGIYRLEFVPPDITGLAKKEFTITLQTDRFLLIDFCPDFLPIVVKN